MQNLFKKISLSYQLRKDAFSFLRHSSGLNKWDEDLTTSLKHEIEKYWSQKLCSSHFTETDLNREKYYVLSMFPYPSGHLHMGHVRVYTISDSIARFQRMNGKNVIHPIGWDAFGLPAENAAIERQVHPAVWTKQNIEYMKYQLQQLGCSFEWEREISTCDPSYYRWTQSLFIKLFKAGLAYQKEAVVNWDPVDQTVLADEQVDENGKSWRSGAKVEKKFLRQWFIKTTNFAKDLLDGLDDEILQDWRDIIKIQKNWIGECNGVNFDFEIVEGTSSRNNFFSIWTPTPEYVEYSKFVAVSKNNILAKCKANNNSTEELSIKLRNPLTNDILPVFITNEIDFYPETDSHLGIPTISDTDRLFAEKYGIKYTNAYLSDDQRAIKLRDICSKARNLNRGGYWTSAKLRDWLISRQRYWGTPIPIIHCDSCGPQPVPDKELPVQLPELKNVGNKGILPLSENKEWLAASCPNCGNPGRRESDTMDTFVDSSWYYLRYLDPKNPVEMFSVKKAKQMMPVDLYIGGKEHATLHLYYARFIGHFLNSLNLIPYREPFKRLLVQGMVMGRSYRIKGSGRYVSEDQIKIIDLKRNKAVHKDTNEAVVIAWEKMSKSKHNGVDPTDMFREYGVDTTRLLILADVAPTSHRNWNSNTFPGILNWQKRLWLTIKDFLKHRTHMPIMISEEQFKKHDDYMFDSRNFYVKGATFNYVTSQQMSVAISKMQGLTNSLRRVPPAIFAHSLQFERALACQIILLAPIAPHFASELWSGFISAPNCLNNSGEIEWNKTVLEQQWPEVDLHYNLDLVCQINGTENAVIKIPRAQIEKLTKEEALEIALKHPKIQEMLSSWLMVDSVYTLYKGYEAVINILTKSTRFKKAEGAKG